MNRTRRVIIGLGSAGLGATGLLILTVLREESMHQVGQWITVVGFFVSTAVSAVGVVLAWLTWRQGEVSSAKRSAEESVVARGAGSVAVLGEITAEIVTDVADTVSTLDGPVPSPGTHAHGSAAIAVNGPVHAPIRTSVRGTWPGRRTRR